MVIAREEIFGPVLSIITVEDENEAVAVANDSDFGLAASVWSSDQARAAKVARRLDAGSITVNGAPFNADAPYGGLKQSGLGHELGVAGIEEWLDLKVIHF